jgi:hypothetical protein
MAIAPTRLSGNTNTGHGAQQLSGLIERVTFHGQQFTAKVLRMTAPAMAEGVEKYLASGLVLLPMDDRRSRLCPTHSE